MDGIMRTGRNAKSVKIAFGMVDDSLAINQCQRTMRANLDTFPRTATFCQIDADFHCRTLSDGYISPHRRAN